MPIYYLRPSAGEISDPRWQGSSYRGSCIVHAPSPHSARDHASREFRKTGANVGGEVVTSPWRDPELVACAEIASSVPHAEGMVEIPVESQRQASLFGQ